MSRRVKMERGSGNLFSISIGADAMIRLRSVLPDRLALDSEVRTLWLR
jgi:hypothetical protein